MPPSTESNFYLIPDSEPTPHRFAMLSLRLRDRTSKFAEQIDERHLADRVDWRTGDTRICHDDGETLRAGHGDVDPVAVKDESKASGPVLAVTGTE